MMKNMQFMIQRKQMNPIEASREAWRIRRDQEAKERRSKIKGRIARIEKEAQTLKNIEGLDGKN